MSTLRNAAPRRPHKERSQPSSRSKWGLLEKHKDYSLRARDYNLKQRKLSILQSKARDRNPDEFAFGMLRTDTARQGHHGKGGDRSEDKLSVDAAKLLKTQDAGYLRTVGQKGRRELEELEKKMAVQKSLERDGERKEVGEGQARKGNKRIVFVEGEGGKMFYKKAANRLDEQPAGELSQPTGGDDAHMGEINGQNGQHDNGTLDDSTLTSHKSSPPPSRKQAIAAHQAQIEARAARKRRKRLGEARATKLEALKKRQKEIMAAAERVELQRAKMARSVGGTNKDGVKFRIRERKK
ncbi:MAG: hypothetical protein Q9160_004957 [Pyrenula sp. 1 TL-2023]